ncbi:GNAT family N-acetyltransferase [Rhabdobacter roseus]|uniref:Ribosomal protein S18 acetylase RimI-like enzyme n=1 Tax=Rhabdobacter roseus TaxID=1655419 RepID=A0A840TTQ5_9BACT|nr:GNAT family N-acetyltransferase [Rhabdobacter roseus]MBB5283069.1 ribosomal protein S18 acetylase RimI-like enzyme [Rhabdobacter roseus]
MKEINNTVHIVPVTPADLPVLRELARQTFYEAFSEANTPEDLQKYLDAAFTDQKLRTELEEVLSAFYFAKIDDQPVGYLKVNVGAAQTELHEPESMEIERIYVLAAYLGQGVGQVLFEEALRLARAQARKYLWLGVWEHNARALRFYEKNGFVAFGSHSFRLGEDEQTDILMRLTL